jgi:hypothetical protein
MFAFQISINYIDSMIKIGVITEKDFKRLLFKEGKK